MRRTSSFQIGFACAALSMVLAVLAAALITSRSSTDHANLERTLETTADERAALVETELERAQALTLVTAQVPAFLKLYAGAGSLAPNLAAGAGLRAEINHALRYLWQLYPARFVEAGYVDISGVENSRIVRGTVTPASALRRNVQSWPSFWQGATTPVGSAWISEPFSSPTAGVPVVAATTTVAVNGRVRGYVELELAMSALSRLVFASGAEQKLGLAIVNSNGQTLAHTGRSFPIDANHTSGQLTTTGGWRVSVHAISGAATPEPWFVVAGGRPPSTLDAIGPAEGAMIALALILLVVASYALFQARSDASHELAAEQQARAEAERRSRIDPLTGLFNRRHAMETIDHELARSERAGTAIGLLMFDVDRFKRINDQHGHAGGDAALVEIGRRLRTGVRVFDTVARVGGEEFCVIVPGADREEHVAELGDRLREAVAGRAVIVGAGAAVPVTISAGASIVHAGEGSAEHAIDRADRALYAAKRLGRNLLCRFSALDSTDLRSEQPECLHIAEALAVVQDVREGVSALHSRRVAELSATVARRLCLPEDEVLRALLGGWLHDVGKVAVSDEILSKPGPLTDAEWESMRTHPVVGEELVCQFAELALAAKAVRHHHERYDGTGYPDGLAGDEIPLEARIVAAVDAYSVMTSDRPYKKAGTAGSAAEELRRCAGTHFDPIVVAALLEELEQCSPKAEEQLEPQPSLATTPRE